jgi:hypothetical protein
MGATNPGLVKGVHYAVAAKSTGVSEIVSSLNASSCFTLFSEVSGPPAPPSTKSGERETWL